jgi:translocator protein
MNCIGNIVCFNARYKIDILKNIIINLLRFGPLIIGMYIGYLYKDKWSEEYYVNLKKPKYNPPNYVFSIVWPILYLLIGFIYAYSLYDTKCISTKLSKCGISVLFKDFKYWIIPLIALIFNFIYTPVFFAENGLLNGFIVIIFALVFAILTLIQFIMQKTYGPCGTICPILALGPYIAWLCFATYLAYNIYKLNNEKVVIKNKNI